MSDNMRVDSILSQIRAIRNEVKPAAPEGVSPLREVEPAQDSFAKLLTESVSAVSETQKNAAGLAQAFERGDANVSLAEVMVASQKSSVAFTAMVEVRNKMIDAYQEVMRMSV